MSIAAEREAILERFTCAHVRLTRAPLRDGSESEPSYHWAPGCNHPKMHLLFDGQVTFCESCPCYTTRHV